MSEQSFDVIAVGDTTQDIFLQMSDAAVQCGIDDRNCKICFDYADKIAVDKKTDVPAVGNAANHAIGAARLGLRVGLYTIVGNDAQGKLAQEVLTKEGVDAQYVVTDQERGTNFSAVINFKGERTILVYHEPRDYQLPDLDTPRFIYLTSASGDGVNALHAQMVEYLAAHPEVRLAFNPGTHQMHLGKEALLPLLERTEWLFLNREESAEVLGVETHDIMELLQAYHAIGVANMVITDGPQGAYASDGKTVYFLPIFAGEVIERTGAGDSFGSGFLSATLHGKSLGEALLWGNANSTSVVRYIGAREGLLDQAGIRELVAQNPDIIPQEFATL